jgi:hypothetical protein
MGPSFAFAIVLLSAGFASANPIISVTGTHDTAFFVGGSAADEMLVSSWTETGSYINVSISAVLSNQFGGNPNSTLSAYLTDRIGPGTTAADVIASTSISPTTFDETDTLFTGLSLGAGSYYLVLAAPGKFAGWWGTNSPTITTDTGVTDTGYYYTNLQGNGSPDDAFPPASTFSPDTTDFLLYSATGTASSATPEPSSFILAGLAGIFLFSVKSRLPR